MTTTPAPLVYVILGAAGSGRRRILADLVEGGLAEEERALVVLSADETPDPAEASLGRILRWTRNGDSLVVPREEFGDATHLFWVADGRGNPVDQLEQFHAWLALSGCALARVITVVNCRWAEQHPELVAWYEACIHFSDVVLLTSREGVANKWLSDFQNRFKDQFFPCLFEFVKDGRVKNPPLVLEPEARRVSHLFDEPDWEVLDEEDEEDEDADSEEEVEVVLEVDPYLERRAGGRRVREIPDVAKFLS
jgi:hypothetical protein